MSIVQRVGLTIDVIWTTLGRHDNDCETTMAEDDSVVAWHFCANDRLLGYGDGRKIHRGAVFQLPSATRPQLCRIGFHGAINALDALEYAPGPIVSRTEHRGRIIRGGDKLVSSVREHIVVADATDVLIRFAQRCAYAARVACNEVTDYSAARVEDAVRELRHNKRCWIPMVKLAAIGARSAYRLADMWHVEIARQRDWLESHLLELIQTHAADD